MRAWQLLKTKKQWCQGAFAMDKDGFGVSLKSRKRVRFCVWGAIKHCYVRNPSKYEEVFERFNKKLGNGRSIVDWNDNPKRKFSEVKALLKKLDI